MAMAATSPALAVATTPWERFRAQSRFGSLDGLRALAILPVIWHHGPGDDLQGIGHTGYYGVPLFFAISGFLITTLLLREREATGTVSLRNFYARRTLRIFPLYYAVLALDSLLLYLKPPTPEVSQFFHQLPLYAMFLTNWARPPGAIFILGWSLAVEEQFYATWPALLSRAPVAIAASCAAFAFLAAFVIDLHFMVPLAITGGCLFALALHSRRGFELVWTVLGWRGAPAICLLIVGAALISIEQEQSTGVQLALTVLAGSCVLREDHALARILRFRPLAYIGSVSYGMYLLHSLVYDALGHNPYGWNSRGLAGFFVTVPLTVFAATLSYRLFESPFLRLKTRFRAA